MATLSRHVEIEAAPLNRTDKRQGLSLPLNPGKSVSLMHESYTIVL